jgi:hypothetical protein
VVFGGFDEIFLPSASKAREELESQKLVGEALPAPTDPPELEPVGLVTDDPSTRFRGKIVIRRP